MLLSDIINQTSYISHSQRVAYFWRADADGKACYTIRMITIPEARPKITWRERAEAEFAKLLAAAQTRGFYGTATFTVNVQDGSIQYLRVAVERMVK
jgi:hypothetical protein